MIAIGLGCKKGTSGAAIAALVTHALTLVPHEDKSALFTSEAKQSEAGLPEAAALLGFDLLYLSDTALQAVASKVVTRSARVAALFGLPSIAEAAALAGAGTGATLLVKRISADGVSCALARGTGAWRKGETL